jgi:hypothetical protein
MKFNMKYKWCILTVLLLGSIVLLGSFVSSECSPVAPVLPQPTGSYGVGTAQYHFIDTGEWVVPLGKTTHLIGLNGALAWKALLPIRIESGFVQEFSFDSGQHTYFFKRTAQ